MRAIRARFPSRCATCNGPIAEGDEILYDPAAKKTYHPDCAPEDEDEKPDPRSEELAERLGFE